MKSVLGIHWKVWCWSWNSNTLATWCEDLTHLKRPWFWERLRVGGEGDDRGWDGWVASLIRWTWVWVDSGSCWWTGGTGVLRFMESQRVGTQLSDWTELNWISCFCTWQLSFQLGCTLDKRTSNTFFSMCVFSHGWLFGIPWTIACQTPLSMEFSSQEYWSGLPLPTPRDLSNPGIESASLKSPALETDSLPLHHLGSPARFFHICSNVTSTSLILDYIM